MVMDRLALALGRRWLGKRGVTAVYADGNQLVVETRDGHRPRGLPAVFGRRQIVVRRGGPYNMGDAYQAGSRSGPWSRMGGELAEGGRGSVLLNPSAETEESWLASPTVQKISYAVGLSRIITTPLAMALSYQQNRSIFWAVIHGVLIPTPYLAYRAIGGGK